jgi:hypothetical protein
MWDFRLLWWRVWSLESSGMKCRVVKLMLTDISTVCTASIIIALSMEAVCTYETSVNINLTTWRYIPEDSNLYVYLVWGYLLLTYRLSTLNLSNIISKFPYFRHIYTCENMNRHIAIYPPKIQPKGSSSWTRQRPTTAYRALVYLSQGMTYRTEGCMTLRRWRQCCKLSGHRTAPRSMNAFHPRGTLQVATV